jgi:hypothetical protein
MQVAEVSQQPHFDKVAVAQLTQEGIAEMTADELVAAIQTITLPSGRLRGHSCRG